jgi:hypothetical protein
LHGGTLSGLPPVDACLRDPKLLNVWGVEKTATLIATVDGKDQFIDNPLLNFKYGEDTVYIYRHPELYISEDVRAWYESYSMSDHIGQKSYSESNYLWFEALKIYKNAYRLNKQKVK